MVSKIGIFSVGTGGHIVPSVRIVDELIQKGILKEEILVVTGKRNEKKFYKNYDIDVLEHDFIRSEGGIFYYIFNVYKIVTSTIFLCKVIKQYKLKVIFTTGAYIAPLAALSGWYSKIPIYIQEQNKYAGLGNKFASIFSKKSYTSFPNTINLFKKNNINYVGPVLSKKIEENVKKHTESFSIGVQGGSQGSKEINDLVCSAFNLWDEFNIKVHHITGDNPVDPISNDLIDYSTSSFLEEMSGYYDSIDIQITRGGGGLLEGASFGIPQLILPYKFGTTSNHQNDNANYFVENNAGIMLSTSPNDLISNLKNLIVDKDNFRIMQKNAKKSVKLGARKLIASDLINEYKKYI
tara:strand:+ start:7 stop:1059 length:1053 start_codon:yes stop_codon:yes gene_type:complete